MRHSLRVLTANWRLMLVAVLSLGMGLAATVLGFGAMLSFTSARPAK